MPVIKYIRLPFQFDVPAMQKEVTALSDLHWQLHYQKLHYTGNWSGIPLRSINGEAGNVIISPDTNAVYRDTIFLQQCPYLATALSSFHCPLKAVRLLKLDAGAEIKEHRDAELSYEHGEVRLHIPVITNSMVEFMLDKEPMRLQEGECWYLNFNLPHSLNNKGREARIHLVIDAVVNEWIKALFAQPGLVKKETEETKYDDATRRLIIAQLRLMGTDTANCMADKMEQDCVKPKIKKL